MTKEINTLYTSANRLGVKFRSVAMRNQFRHILSKLDSDETKKINSLVEEFIEKHKYLLDDFQPKYNEYEIERASAEMEKS